MTPETIQNEIRGYIVQAFCDGVGDGIGFDTPLVQSGIVDSAGVVQVVLFLESHFQIQVDDLEVRLENFDTITSMAGLVLRLREAG